MAKDDNDINWDDDDLFGGDMDFDMDFEDSFDPFKNKSFLGATAEGILGSVVGGTVGSIDAVIRTARTYLPDSYSNALDKVSYLKDKGSELLREFEEENYESVKSLQSIAKNIAGRIGDENSSLKRSLIGFTEKDFSSWEKSSNSDNKLPELEEVQDSDVFDKLSDLFQQQTGVFENVMTGINQMAGYVGGNIKASVMAGNRELIGIQSGIRDLLAYQQNVQAKMDQAKVELLARTFMVNAKFYKFMEKALHTEINELRKITHNTGLSDYQKTSLYSATKEYARNSAFNVIGRRAGGLLGELKSSFGKDGRKDKYNMFQSLFGSIDDTLSMADGITPSRGMVGNMIGGMIGDFILSEMPRFFNQGPFTKFADNIFSKNPELKEKYEKTKNKVTGYGNQASYYADGLMGLLNAHAENWQGLDEQKYRDYEDYVDKMEKEGKKPLPESLFTMFNAVGNQGKSFINDYMFRINQSQGMRYSLNQRSANDLAKPGIWKEINNVTLTDVIPGLLTRIYGSLEKMRTGNDDFEPPVYSYRRGQFVSSDKAKKVIISDVFDHSSFNSTTKNALEIVDKIDPNNKLSPQERQAFAMEIIRNADKGNHINPMMYSGKINGMDQSTNDVINALIKKRYGIDDQTVDKYNKADSIERIRIEHGLVDSEHGSELKDLQSMNSNLVNGIPNISKALTSSLNIGTMPLLRSLGLIETKNGQDRINHEMIFQRYMEYLKDPNNPELKGEVGDLFDTDAGATITGGSSNKGISSLNNKVRRIKDSTNSLNETTENTTRILNETMDKFTKQMDLYQKNISKMDFSNLQIDFGNIPDTLSSMKEVLEKIHSVDEKHESLLEQIASCVCRQANGWGSKSKQEKNQIDKDEDIGKKTILDRLKALNPRGVFNKGVETLISNQPLVLGAMLGGLTTLAFHDPKAAMLVTGGMIAAKAYSKLGEYARARTVGENEDIYDENGELVLSRKKLENGDYYDAVSREVIKQWKDITGAVYDIIEKSYIGIKVLTGKLFGADGRQVIISGLSKVRDTLVKVWDKADIFSRLKDGFNYGKDMLYQQDVFVKGEKNPVLTRAGFRDGSYYCFDLKTNKPFLIKGWNEIDGPVYELDVDGTLTQIVSESQLARGLVTSTGVSIDKLASATKWLGGKVWDGLGKAKDYGLEKAGIIKDKAQEIFKNDYSGIENRLDRIYYLLCKQFGFNVDDAFAGLTINGIPPGAVNNPIPSTTAEEDGLNGVKDIVTNTVEEIKKKEFESQYPNKIKLGAGEDGTRLNSLKDKELKEEKARQEEDHENLRKIAENTSGIGDSTDDGKKKKGIFGVLGGLLASGGKLLVDLVKNPIGTIGGLLFGTILKAPGRIIKMGSLLFSGVVTPLYNVLSWGFSGMMWGLRKLLFSNTETLTDWFAGRRAGRRGRRRTGRRVRRYAGKIGKLVGLGLAAYSGYEMYKGIKGIDLPKRDILKGADENFDRFYGDPSADIDDSSEPYSPSSNPQNDIEGMDDTEAAVALGGGALQLGSMFGKKGASAVSGTGLGGRVLGGASRLGTKVFGEAAMKGAGKLGAKAIPILGQALAALDFYDGFTDKESIARMFNTNQINGKQRLSSGIGNVLDLGGVFSGLSGWAADKTGLEFLRADGGVTRAIDSVLSAFTSGPLKYITPIGWGLSALEAWKTDVTEPQFKLRMAMYGIKDPNSDLGRAVYVLENKLSEYVKFNQNSAWLDSKAPIGDLLTSFTNHNPEDTARWYKLRFEPVFLIYQSAIRMLGYKDINEFDRSTNPNVLQILEQVMGAIKTIRPYPYEIIVQIDTTTPIMTRPETETVVSNTLAELREKFKEKGVKADGTMDVVTKLKTEEQVRSGKDITLKNFLFVPVGDLFDSLSAKTSNYFAPQKVEVTNIVIDDLHNEKDDMDELTLIRLAVYGNDENEPWRVDTVLRLERYCEQFLTFTNGICKFTGNVNEIYNLFSNSFRCTNYWSKTWINWFNRRFIPTLTQYASDVYALRRNLPGKVWKSLTATNKHVLAGNLVALKVKVEDKLLSVWEIPDSPFSGTKSVDDAKVIDGYMNNLKIKATDAKLKTPDLESEKSKSVDSSNVMSKKESDELYQQLINKGRVGGANENVSTDSSDVTNSYQYKETVDKALGNQGYQIPGNSAINEYERNMGDFGGKAVDFIPNVTTTDKGFELQQKEAEKLIINEFVKAGITDNKLLAFALANAKSETNFKGRAESLNYTPQALLATFPSRFNRQQAEEYGRVDSGPNKHPANQQMIAKLAYGGRYGNTSGDDGWLYRGRGFTQLTFKGNYKAVGDAIGDPTIVNNPEKVTNDPVTAAKSAAGFFKIHPEIASKLARGDVAGAAAVVGKHAEGIAKKVSYFPEYLKRLTDGDLKNILSADPNAKSEDQSGVQTNEVATPDRGINKETIVSNTSDVENAAQRTNAPPAPSDDTSPVPTTSPMVAPTETTSPVTSPVKPNNEVSSPTQTTSPVEPTPPPKEIVKEKPVEVKPTELKLPDGVMKVQDDGVIGAIASLGEILQRTLNSNATSRMNDGRVRTN